MQRDVQFMNYWRVVTSSDYYFIIIIIIIIIIILLSLIIRKTEHREQRLYKAFYVIALILHIKQERIILSYIKTFTLIMA